MKHNIQKALAIGILAASSSYALALPLFTFTEVAGFEIGDVGVAAYGPAIGGADAPANVASSMAWYLANSTDDRSVLSLTNPGADTAIAHGDWTTITTLFHENNSITPGSQGWSGQDIIGRLNIKDDFGLNFVNEDPITINLVETANVAGCGGLVNPTGSAVPCDDFFTFTSVGLADLDFTAGDGTLWTASFRLENFFQSSPYPVDPITGAFDTVYTAENVTSSLDVQMMLTQRVSEVPEPATLGLFGLGLLGLGIAKRRKQNA